MAWGCNCRNKVPDSPPYQWPVTLAECTGKERNCEIGCNDQPAKDLCIEGCNKYFRCNRPGGPQSRLQTLHPDIAPNYDTTTAKSNTLSPLSGGLPLLLLLLSIIIIMCFVGGDNILHFLS
ncbi:hypothetical protein BDA99DRAFT_587930 [Phascolomyces articulosus]|uniref:Uncharacterized protein n=1 Tax=Phascolomyces articulosus TaxID=60185 RepID=A0AAD5JT49_9FUNG|nr:hypothetical protein BDA99DRAFT_587930 [Phascolomyces articulosus]